MTQEHTTRAQFRAKVYDRLGETGVFWPEAEINSSLEEALLTFGAISNFWTEEIFFTTEENKRVYDLFSDVVINSGFIYPSLTFEKIIEWINKDLIETVSEDNPNPEFLSLDELLKLIETKYNLYQQLISLVVSTIEIDVAPDQLLITLPDNLIDIVRVTFLHEDGEIFLFASDEAELTYFNQGSLNKSEYPIYYSIILKRSKKISLYPTPNVVGKIKLVYISGSSGELGINKQINLPNNLIPYIKYGVEADIFGKEGVTQDLTRSAYCKQRWEEGIIIG